MHFLSAISFGRTAEDSDDPVSTATVCLAGCGHFRQIVSIPPATNRGPVHLSPLSMTLRQVSPNPLINNVIGGCNSQMTISNPSYADA